MPNCPVSVEDFIGHFEDLAEIYRLRIQDLRHIGKKRHGNAKLYRETCNAKAEELEQCVIEIKKIIDWFKDKRMNIPLGKREFGLDGQLKLVM